MYFISNNDDYIVAASKDFLEKSGSRDLCAIASALKDGLFTLENETKSFLANNFEDYEYEHTTLYSSFGNLTLYTIRKKEEKIEVSPQDDESISYLKQLKEGLITKSDNEFSIPTIETLQKKETQSKETNEETIETKESLPPISLEEKEEEEKSIVSQEQEENKTEVKSDETSFETIKLFNNTLSEESEEENAPKDRIKLFDYDTGTNKIETPSLEQEITPEVAEKEEKNQEVQTLKIIQEDEEQNKDIKEAEPEYIEEAIEVKPLDETQLKLEEELEKPVQEKIIEIPTTSGEGIEELVTEEKNKKGLSKLKEKLFPWGSKSKKKIELEESEILKTASDLQEEEKESNESIKEATKEETTKDVESRIEEVSLEPLKSENTEQLLEIPEETIPVKEEKQKEELDSHLKLAEEEKEENKLEEKKENEELDKRFTLNEFAEEDNKTTLEKTHEEASLEERELAELKAMHAESIAPVTKQEEREKEPLTVKAPEKNIMKENTQLYYKIIEMQVESIHFETNAQNLNIDVDSYKMLLENYLDELENYNDDIKNRVHSTITMLADAGELLSLKVISKKLNEIAIAPEPAAPIRDLTLLVSLLRDKLSNKTDKKTILDKKPFEIEEAQIEEEDILDNKIIEISSAETLLSDVAEEAISYDPKKAADELNLPVSLILEFADDFIEQAKEHLSQMVKAYKEKDLKTLQTTAHMLKGAASNLRIDPLAENLFAIQKLQSFENADELIIEFVAKLKGLATKLKALEGSRDEN